MLVNACEWDKVSGLRAFAPTHLKVTNYRGRTKPLFTKADYPF